MSCNDERRPLLFPELPGTSNVNHIEDGTIGILRSHFNIHKVKEVPKTSQEMDDNDDTPDARAFHFAMRGSVVIVFLCILSVVLVAYTVPYNVRFGRRKGPNLVEDSSVTEIDIPVLAIPKAPLIRAGTLDLFSSSKTMTTSAKDNIKIRDEDEEVVDSTISTTSTVSDSSSSQSNTVVPGHSTGSTVNIKGPVVAVVEEETGSDSTTTTKVSDETEKIIDDISTKTPPPPSQDTTTTTTTTTSTTSDIPPTANDEKVTITSSTVSVPSSSTEDKPTKAIDQLDTPNFLFVLADDLGYNSISAEIGTNPCRNNTYPVNPLRLLLILLLPLPLTLLSISTQNAAPFMYNIRSQGVNIPQYYTADVCTPARASLLTGRYAYRTTLHRITSHPLDHLLDAQHTYSKSFTSTNTLNLMNMSVAIQRSYRHTNRSSDLSLSFFFSPL